jgi:predicted aspartyl protease
MKGKAMAKPGVKSMGRFAVEVELANYQDVIQERLGQIPAAQVRRATIRGVVDPGATRLVLPRNVVKQLGLVTKRKVKVRYADGRRSVRPEVDNVHVKLLDRDDVFTAIVEPKRESALIGAIVLEDLDFLVDCTKQCLVPRDPRYVVSEIE